MRNIQPGILAPIPPLARYLGFSLCADVEPSRFLQSLHDAVDVDEAVIGIGPSLVQALGKNIDGLRNFSGHSGPGLDVPATPMALWCWLRGDDRGELVHSARAIEHALFPAFELIRVIDAFQYRDSRDLTGYEDGTENPQGEDALAAAIVSGLGKGLDGSSFVAVQQWLHDLDHFQSLDEAERDHVIGRRISTNEEIEDAPESAHVKRTAQEDFEPAALVLRRSMPWADAGEQGLVFVAFGKSFAAFEALLNRMLGADDGIVDALFRISRPVTGSYFWCPPVKDGKLDLQVLDL